LLEIFEESFDTADKEKDMGCGRDHTVFNKISDYYKNLLLKEVHDDARKAELILRHFYSPKSNFREKRKDLVRIRNIRQLPKLNEGTELLVLAETLRGE